ncbi:hypothetical protein IWZ00DRAFT_239013 [Phyllosticta capitalensis]
MSEQGVVRFWSWLQRLGGWKGGRQGLLVLLLNICGSAVAVGADGKERCGMRTNLLLGAGKECFEQERWLQIKRRRKEYRHDGRLCT